MTDVRLTATNPEDSSVVPVACNTKGELKLEEPIKFDGDLDGDLNVTGSANLGSLEFGQGGGGGEDLILAKSWYRSGVAFGVNAQGNGHFAGSVFVGDPYVSPANTLSNNGGCIFANGLAGLTPQGNFWCTTLRGNTVMLNNLVNGLGEWVEYVPSRSDLLAQWTDEPDAVSPEDSSKT